MGCLGPFCFPCYVSPCSQGATANIDTETGNMQTVVKDKNLTLCLWANLKKNPRSVGWKGTNGHYMGLYGNTKADKIRTRAAVNFVAFNIKLLCQVPLKTFLWSRNWKLQCWHFFLLLIVHSGLKVSALKRKAWALSSPKSWLWAILLWGSSTRIMTTCLCWPGWLTIGYTHPATGTYQIVHILQLMLQTHLQKQ